VSTAAGTLPAVPIDVAFVGATGTTPGAWNVVHSDGTVLFSSQDESSARQRLDQLRALAKSRMAGGHEVTGGDMLTLFPPTAPAPLVMAALSAEELKREDVFDSASKTWLMRNVEIFRSGVALKQTSKGWKKLPFTTDDVRAFVEAFAALGWTPPLKIGHEGDQAIVLEQLPTLARVVAVREAKVRGRNGSDELGLFADLEKVPQALHDAIREGRLFQRSIEFWSDQIPRPTGEGTFPRVLKAVALLGSDLPAVAGMPPIDVAPAKFAAGESHTVNLNMETEPIMAEPKPGEGTGANVIQLSADEYAKQRQERETLKAETERQKAQLEELTKLTQRLSVERTVESATSAASRLRDAGKVTPAQEPYVLELLKALDDEKKDAVVVALATKDGPKESKFSARGALLALLETFPKHAGAPGVPATKSGSGGPVALSAGYAALTAEQQSAEIAKLGEKYAAESKDKSPRGMSAAYERARKDLASGAAEVVQ
jgi:hypothetical protein